MSQDPIGQDHAQEGQAGITTILRNTLADILARRAGWTSQENWPKVQRLARALPDGRQDGGHDTALHAWRQKFQGTSDDQQEFITAIQELESALRTDLGEQGNIQEVRGRYIIDTLTGEIIRKRSPGSRPPLRGQPRKWGQEGKWIVWIPPGQGRTSQPGDTVEVRMKNGRTRTVTVKSVINTLHNGAQNVRVNWQSLQS